MLLVYYGAYDDICDTAVSYGQSFNSLDGFTVLWLSLFSGKKILYDNQTFCWAVGSFSRWRRMYLSSVFRYAIYIISFGPLCKLVHPCKECKMFNQCIKKVFLQSNLLKRYLFCTVPSHTGIWDSTQGKKCEKSRKLKSLKFRKVKNKNKTKNNCNCEKWTNTVINYSQTNNIVKPLVIIPVQYWVVITNILNGKLKRVVIITWVQWWTWEP